MAMAANEIERLIKARIPDAAVWSVGYQRIRLNFVSVDHRRIEV